MPDDSTSFMPTPSRWRQRLILASLIVIVGLLGSVALFVYGRTAAPSDFPIATPITIPAGTTISGIVDLLAEAHVVQSPLLLYIVLLTQYEPSDIKASTYVFDQPYDVFDVAEKLATGDFTSNLIRLTHTEGERASTIAATAKALLPDFDSETFITLATPHEGKLFPETYFIPPHHTAADLLATLLASYETHIAPLRPEIAASGMTEAEVITLASILEREANSEESMGMVAGILRNRLDINMPLQADASIEYVLNKPLGALVPGDLSIDSPYNTYLNRGLPPTAIGNPGLTAITAVLRPTPSDYLFYITGNDGTFHYAVTYEDHKRNIARYLSE